MKRILIPKGLADLIVFGLRAKPLTEWSGRQVAQLGTFQLIFQAAGCEVAGRALRPCWQRKPCLWLVPWLCFPSIEATIQRLLWAGVCIFCSCSILEVIFSLLSFLTLRCCTDGISGLFSLEEKATGLNSGLPGEASHGPADAQGLAVDKMGHSHDPAA